MSSLHNLKQSWKSFFGLDQNVVDDCYLFSEINFGFLSIEDEKQSYVEAQLSRAVNSLGNLRLTRSNRISNSFEEQAAWIAAQIVGISLIEQGFAHRVGLARTVFQQKDDPKPVLLHKGFYHRNIR